MRRRAGTEAMGGWARRRVGMKGEGMAYGVEGGRGVGRGRRLRAQHWVGTKAAAAAPGGDKSYGPSVRWGRRARAWH